ncbi:MAG: methionyl-tRNA formyltransferase [bacterium]
MPILFFGTPRFAVPALDALVESGETLSLVVTQPDRRKGRDHYPSPPPVKIAAAHHKIPVEQPLKLNDHYFLDKLKALSPEFIVVIAYGKILPREILDIPTGGCLNVHASLLPAYRGAAPVQWSLIKGEKVTGVTTMLMDEGMDTGSILIRREVAIARKDDGQTLSDRLSRVSAALLIETLRSLRSNTVQPKPQEGVPSYAPSLTKEEGRINWQRDAEDLFNFVRGMYPWPCAFSFFRDKYIKILETEPIAGTGRPGTIAAITPTDIQVGTKNGLLSIKKVQMEGKKPVDALSFINGYRVKVGESFD